MTDKQVRSFRLDAFADVILDVGPEWLVTGVIGAKALAVMYGDPGCGKSFLAADMGLHIATGQPWGGKDVLAGTVVYVAAEGASGFYKRLVAYRQHHAVNIPIPFHVVADCADLGRLGGDTPALIEAIREQAESPIRLVVVDTLARAMCGADENSAAAMSAFVNNCSRIADDLGCAVLVIHHTGKDAAKGARGSTVLKAAADVEIALNGRDDRRVASVTKNRDGAAGLSLTFRLDPVVLDGTPAESRVVNITADWRCNAATVKPVPILNTGAKLALQALNAAIADHVKHNPNGSKPDKFGCPVAVWRRHCHGSQITEADTPEAKRKAFKRAAERLQLNGIVKLSDDWVWLNE